MNFSENLELPQTTETEFGQSLRTLASAFSITADGGAVDITTPLTVFSGGSGIAYRISPVVRQGQAVVLSYSDPTSGDDAIALQDAAGNETSSFTSGSSGVPAVTNDSIEAAVVPGAPTDLSADANGTTVINLSWTAPADNGGRVISGYKIEWSAAGSAPWTVLVATTDRTATTYSNTGLSSGTTRHYRVFAINTIGTGAVSNTNSATTLTRANTAPRPRTAR